MERLEEKHFNFLKICAESPNKIHESDLPEDDLNQMVKENLLIKYNGLKTKYAISRFGVQFVKESVLDKGKVSPEIRNLAIKYVMSKGYELPAAEVIVDREGANFLLQSQAQELKNSNQKEVKIPVNAEGKSEIRFRK